VAFDDASDDCDRLLVRQTAEAEEVTPEVRDGM